MFETIKKAIKEYQDKAPERRKADLERLEHQLKREEIKKRLKKIKEKEVIIK